MKNETDLYSSQREIISANDDIVIVKNLGDIPGGRCLDLTNWNGAVKAGHIIVKNESTGKLYPLGVSEAGAYNALQKETINEETSAKTGYNESVVGVLVASIDHGDPSAAIMTRGQVNGKAMPYEPTTEIKTALPLIEFLYL